jgi:hypothetical protein
MLFLHESPKEAELRLYDSFGVIKEKLRVAKEHPSNLGRGGQTTAI